MDRTAEKKEEIVEGTMAFYFNKPQDFVHKSGQSIDMILPNPAETDEAGNKRAFSLITTHQEDTIGIATRMRDTAFKRVLKTMPIGGEVEIDGPFGSMTLHNDTNKPAVFFAGGIGITPFYSIIKDATLKDLPHRLYLFYSNRRQEDAPFLEELKSLAEQNNRFTLIATMTEQDMSAHPWDGELGFITKEMVLKYIPELTKSIAYMAGPAKMVHAMRGILNDAGLNDDYIRSEEFTGY